MEKTERKIRSYAIRSARMRPSMKNAYDDYYDSYCIDFSDAKLTYKDFFDLDRIVIEIGFGMGDATIEIAEKSSDTGYIAIDVHRPGIAKILKEINDKKLKNIKIIEHDAVEVFEKMIPDDSLDGLHIFFPDPWPKKRHHKRRLIKDEFIALVSTKLKIGGYIYICTDWEEYAGWILDVMNKEKALKNKYDGFAPRQEWRPLTKFEKKGLTKEHNIWEVLFVLSDR